MKKIIAFLIIAGGFATQSFASDFTAEARMSYYLFNSKKLRDIYNTGGPNYQFVLSQPLWNRFKLWESVGYFHRNGHSIGGHQRTSIQIVPVSLGVRYMIPTDMFDFYLGLGARYFFLNIHNNSDYVKRHVHANGLGGVAEAGAMYCFADHWFLDVFTNWSYKRIHQGQSVQIGGWDFGAGLGYRF